MSELNKDALEKAGRLANELGWTCHGGIHEPGEYENCVDCSDGADILATKIITAYLGALTEPLATSKPNQNFELVESVEELDKLPVGAVIIDKYGDAGLIDSTDTIGKCVQYAETSAQSIGRVAKHYLPATVLYTPEVRE